MFSLGFEEDTGNFLKSVKRSWGIALFGAIAPFTIAYYSTLSFWGDPNMALLCGLAMTATAVSLTMVSLKSEGLNHTPAATGIMTSAVLDDNRFARSSGCLGAHRHRRSISDDRRITVNRSKNDRIFCSGYGDRRRFCSLPVRAGCNAFQLSATLV